MNRTGPLLSFLSIAAVALAAGQAWAEDAADAVRGAALARQICSECHAIGRTQERSSNPASPRFEVIANVPGMTGIALAASLRTSHRTMPNVILDAAQLDDIIAYILSLKRAD